MKGKNSSQHYLDRLEWVLKSIDRKKIQTLIEIIPSFSKTDHPIFLLGFGGGKVKEILDDMLIIDSDDYGLVEDTESFTITSFTSCNGNVIINDDETHIATPPRNSF